MKISAIFIIAVIAIKSFAQSFQTNSVIEDAYNEQTHSFQRQTNFYKIETITNWVDAPKYYRVVDGKIYNVQTSTLWEDIAYGNSFDAYFMHLEVRAILKDGMLDCDQKSYDTGRDTGTFLSNVDRLILKHYPAEAHIGTVISNCRALRLPNNPGDTVNTYDYGLPCTNKFPVVQIKKEKLKL